VGDREAAAIAQEGLSGVVDGGQQPFFFGLGVFGISHRNSLS
jgi:hypothetical protein